VGLQGMRVFRTVPEVVGTEMVVVLRVAEQVGLERRVAVKVEVGIRLVVEEVQFELVVLVVMGQRSSCHGRSRSASGTLKLLVL
jgi:hypothetical protein